MVFRCSDGRRAAAAAVRADVDARLAPAAAAAPSNDLGERSAWAAADDLGERLALAAAAPPPDDLGEGLVFGVAARASHGFSYGRAPVTFVFRPGSLYPSGVAIFFVRARSRLRRITSSRCRLILRRASTRADDGRDCDRDDCRDCDRDVDRDDDGLWLSLRRGSCNEDTKERYTRQ